MLALTLCTWLLCACGAQRTIYKVPAPTQEVVAGAKVVVIDKVTDARDFLTTPDTQSPRLNGATRKEVLPTEQSRIIGGLAKFVWELPGDGTVQAWTRDLVTAGLRRIGFDVVPLDRAPPGTPVVSVRIDELWCYPPQDYGRIFTMTQQMKAWLHTTIDITTDGRTSSVDVSGSGAHIVHFATDENVRHAFDLATDEYLQQFQRRVSREL